MKSAEVLFIATAQRCKNALPVSKQAPRRRLIAEGASDEGDTRSEAVIAMLQTEVFDALIAIGELSNNELDEVARLDLMGKVSKNIAPLMTASTRLKQFQNKLKADMDKAFEKLEAQSKQGTLDEHTLKRIRTEVYGLIG